jgi:predicted NUDIX family NTP pyrophosphohydrolase
MAAKKSAGILLYRYRHDELEVFLVHPGGPFWARKDAGAWSIPKGEFSDGEDALQAALREFTEETGFVVAGAFRPLAPLRQPSGKWVHVWALAGDCDADGICSNTCSVEWPPRSGRFITIPEVDRAAWLTVPVAQEKILAGQREFLTQLQALLSASP